MSETTPDPPDVHTSTDRGGCTCGEGDAVGDTTPGPCFVDASGFTVHRPPDLTDEEHRRRLWRDLADKDIQYGVDWPGVVRVLFADIDALTAGVEFSTGTDRVELTKDEVEALMEDALGWMAWDEDHPLLAAVESIVAARVAALTAEREELRTSLDYWVELWKKAANGVIGLQADLSEARAELAAANTRCAELEAGIRDLSNEAERVAGFKDAGHQIDSDYAAALRDLLTGTKTASPDLADDPDGDLDEQVEIVLNQRGRRMLDELRSENAALQATLDRISALADEWTDCAYAYNQSDPLHHTYKGLANRLRAAVTPEGKP